MARRRRISLVDLRLRSNEARRPFPRKPSGRRVFCPWPALARSLQPAAGRCAPPRPPWPQPKSLAAAPLVVSKQALRGKPARFQMSHCERFDIPLHRKRLRNAKVRIRALCGSRSNREAVFGLRLAAWREHRERRSRPSHLGLSAPPIKSGQTGQINAGLHQAPQFLLPSIGWRRGLGRGGPFLLVSPLLGPPHSFLAGRGWRA